MAKENENAQNNEQANNNNEQPKKNRKGLGLKIGAGFLVVGSIIGAFLGGRKYERKHGK